jgi:hypothetical protein
MNAIITKLRRSKIELTLVDGKLKVNAPEGVVTRAILDEIKEHKESLIDYIKRVSRKDEFFNVSPGPGQCTLSAFVSAAEIVLLYEFDRSSLAYNMPKVLELCGKLDKKNLEQALHGLIARHESLRTGFGTVNGEPVQQIAGQVSFRLEHYKSHPHQVDQVIKDFIRPFDLQRAPLLRAGLVELSAERHLFLVDMHHIVADGLSQGILIKDFMSLYNQEVLPDLRLQYKDYAVWQHNEEQQEKASNQKQYWLEEFSEQPQVLELPTDYGRPRSRKYKGAKHKFELTPGETRALKALAEEEGTTLFMVVLSLYTIFLSKVGNQEDVVVGVPVAGRQHADLEGVLGMFVNTLPLRNYPAGAKGFREFLTELKQRTLSSFDHQGYPYESLIDELKLDRHTSRNPLFDVMFVFENYENESLKIPGLELRSYEAAHTISKFDLTLEAVETEGILKLSFEYSTELFKADTIDRFVGYFRKIVSAIATDAGIKISAIAILSEAEVHQLLQEFNQHSRIVSTRRNDH